MLEILDIVSKQRVFCLISDFTELKAFKIVYSLLWNLWTCIRQFLSICWSTRMATPEILCCEVPVLLIFCFCKTANPEMPCGEVPVLLNFQFLQNQQTRRCHVVNSCFYNLQFCRMVTLDMPCVKVSDLLIS